jgi:hypothetical protein
MSMCRRLRSVAVATVAALGLLLAWDAPPVAAQGAQTRYRGGRGAGGGGADPAQAAVDLAAAEVALQEQVMSLQASELARLQSATPAAGDPAGRGARTQLVGMQRSLEQLRLQREALDADLAALPAGDLPPESAQRLVALRESLATNDTAIRNRYGQLRTLVPNGAKNELPDPDARTLATGVSGARPATTKEASLEILKIKVRDPQHLIELFGGVPETETPRGSLIHYLEKEKKVP